MDTKKLLEDLLEGNEQNLQADYCNSSYGRGYAEGYHDAIVDAMNRLGIETDEEYFN